MTRTEKAPALRGVPGASINTGRLDNCIDVHDNECLTTAQQKLIILDHLLMGNHLTTLYAREYLGVMYPASRIQALREDGWNIVTHYH
jgi:hypothetical protein